MSVKTWMTPKKYSTIKYWVNAGCGQLKSAPTSVPAPSSIAVCRNCNRADSFELSEKIMQSNEYLSDTQKEHYRKHPTLCCTCASIAFMADQEKHADKELEKVLDQMETQ